MSGQARSQDRPRERHDGKRKALVIAVSDYDNLPKARQLPFCKNDGEEVYQTLLDQGYDIPGDFKLIGRVEGSRIKSAIVNFFAKAVATDTLVFYFSGHGMPDGHGDYFLASSDIDRELPQLNGYAFYELEKERERSIAKRKVAILDCCFSGAAGTQISMGDADDIANVARDKMEDIFKEGEGKCLIASSLGDQFSYKMKDQDYSLFTYYVLEGLKGANGDTVNPVGYVTASALSSYLYDQVTRNGRQQPITKTAISGDIVVAYHPQLAKGGNMEVAFQLFKQGNVAEFNEFTKFWQTEGTIVHGQLEYERKFKHRLKLTGVEILNTNLAGIDLHEADICRNILVGSDLSDANLKCANLADLRGKNIKFRRANLENTYLSRADLSEADLSEANLSGALLLQVDLSDTNLSRANLSNSVIVGCKTFSNLECADANFDGSIIDREGLVAHLTSHVAKNIPNAVTSKEELISKLNEKAYEDIIFNKILQRSVF